MTSISGEMHPSPLLQIWFAHLLTTDGVQIRGPESGGKVEDLPIHLFDVGKGKQMKIPTEILIPETREFEFAQEGFIPPFYKTEITHVSSLLIQHRSLQNMMIRFVTANMRINPVCPIFSSYHVLLIISK